MKNRSLAIAAFVASVVLAPDQVVYSQDGDAGAETKALDSTATQWSFQLAYQTMPDYHNDILSSGSPRPDGLTDYIQLRIVAPLAFEKFTILPRITLRHYENPQGESGIGNTEIFGLIIPKKWDWGTGRMGIGPLVTLPGDEEVARDEWGYGFAAAWVNGKGNWFYGALLTQSWRGVDPQNLAPGTSDTNPLGVAPIVNYLLGRAGMLAMATWLFSTIGIRKNGRCPLASVSAGYLSRRKDPGITTLSIRQALSMTVGRVQPSRIRIDLM